jgi:hypothetical protein
MNPGANPSQRTAGHLSSYEQVLAMQSHDGQSCGMIESHSSFATF